MKLRTFLCVALALAMFYFLPGCVKVRAYTVVKDRVDQDLGTGNQGALSRGGNEVGSAGQRRLTRKTYVTEVEFGRAAKKNKASASKQQDMAVETVQEPASEPLEEVTNAPEILAPSAAPSVSSYTVQNNDTLQNISLKVYGTSKNWKKIFDANAGQLKTPDRIYAGQVLKIPEK
ncbi:MAG: hypothetical protein COX96_07755 [Candidatus Omnitrophica bacterium CG_4_10_14_0_2_um_filter_44_9]|nr:MAG: hypothetical protein COY78_08065 [Candidatus Omnitrophica bacterium CG_4_10_14_0_8_um_filter_44_12]PIZ83454.1 MAG: hypothetical protein COX96_07755 [Candidatus Omnitrophica bacterium CG_4_10_14_0_2_um_filter_44_9]